MKRITFALRNRLLTNANTWTPDNQWLVFDVQPPGMSFTGETIERVNIYASEVEVIYRASQDAYISVVIIHPKSEKYIFIHGPGDPNETRYYGFHRRRGVIAEGGKVGNLDAMDITAPYTSGALRGDGHIHAFSPNGERVSFTCNDHVVHEPDPTLDLQNVGVAALSGPVNVQKQHPREYSGSRWCMLVSKTTSAPQPGGDEVNRTYEEGQIGSHTLASIGDTLPPKGEKALELFTVKLLKDKAGWRATDDVPLSGTETALPAPPRGVAQ